MRPNWFIALPAGPAPELDGLLRQPPRRVRVFAASDRHVTVAFLGGCTEAQARAALRELDDVDTPARDVTLGPVMALGNPARPSALCTGLAMGNHEVAGFMRAHRGRLLVAAEARSDRRPPLPHITFARVQRRADAQEHARAVEWARALPTTGIGLRLGSPLLFTWSEDRRTRLFRRVE